VSLLAAGVSAEWVLASYPGLGLGDIRQALEFAAYHLKESIVPIRVAA